MYKIRRYQLIAFISIGLIIFTYNFGFSSDGKNLDRLLVYGEGFIFGIKEPKGWKADTANASSVNANILFYKPGESIQTAKALIFIRVNKKYDEQVEKDLEWDMDQYRKRYPNVQFKDIAASHAEYKIYPKLFYIKDKFYEYVTFINPGIGKPVTLSIAMNVQKNEASKDVFEAYRKIIRSLVLLKP
ncbi:MAG: hypothetical protein ACYS0I_08425 [Planctomycetota bacterium]|jgi:hypothetical protein